MRVSVREGFTLILNRLNLPLSPPLQPNSNGIRPLALSVPPLALSLRLAETWADVCEVLPETDSRELESHAIVGYVRSVLKSIILAHGDFEHWAQRACEVEVSIHNRDLSSVIASIASYMAKYPLKVSSLQDILSSIFPHSYPNEPPILSL